MSPEAQKHKRARETALLAKKGGDETLPGKRKDWGVESLRTDGGRLA